MKDTILKPFYNKFIYHCDIIYKKYKSKGKRKMKAVKIISYLILSLIFLYILSGFFLLPYIAKKEIVKNLDEILITKTKIEKIYFNPLTLNLELKEFFTYR